MTVITFVKLASLTEIPRHLAPLRSGARLARDTCKKQRGGATLVAAASFFLQIVVVVPARMRVEAKKHRQNRSFSKFPNADGIRATSPHLRICVSDHDYLVSSRGTRCTLAGMLSRHFTHKSFILHVIDTLGFIS